jgi:lipopolysaccharide transport system ATP-binding protein
VKSRYGLELYEAGLYAGESEEKVGFVYFLQACEIRIRVGAPDGFPMAGLVVRVFDELGVLVSSLNSPEEGIEPFTMGPSHTFTYSVPEMSLMPGRYSVSVFVYRPHDPTRYLEAENCFEFEVFPAVTPGGLLAYTKDHGVTRFVSGCKLL